MRTTIVAAGALICLGLLGCNPHTYPVTVWGRVDAASPVDGSYVVLADAVSAKVLWEGWTTDGNFLGQVTLADFRSVGADLVLTASGGTSAGQPFPGTLKAYLSNYLPGQHVEVNILTTLVVAYMDAAHVSYDTARQAVFDYLLLPRDFSLLDSVYRGDSQHLFDSEVFLNEAAGANGFDSFINDLAANQIGVGTPQSFSALNHGMLGVAPDPCIYQLVDTSFSTTILKGAVSGAGSYLGTLVVGYILSAYGYQDEQSQGFAQINEALQEINARLDAISEQIGQVSQQVQAVLDNVTLSRDMIIQQIVGYNITTPINVIENQFNNLALNFHHDNPDAHTSTGHANAAEFAEEIASATGYDIDQKLADLHAGIVGGTVGTVGFLDACTNVLIDRVAAGGDLGSYYMILEDYFAELLVYQAHGLVLMVEALHFLNDDINKPPKSFSGTVEQYCAKYSANIEAQVTKFLTCVDRLVVSRVDVRTDLANTPQFLPDNVQNVYRRADYFAHNLSPNQPAGFIIRLIGTPSEVQKTIDAGIKAVNRVRGATCPDWKQAAEKAGGGCSGTAYENTTTYSFAAVPVNGNTVNLYKATFPSYSAKYYFEWFQQNGSYNTYHLQDKIAVAKFVIGAQGVPGNSSQCYDCDSTGGSTYRLEDWYINPGLRASSSGTLTSQLATYDENFQPAATGTLYGNCVFGLRSFPSQWSTSSGWKSTQGNNEMAASFDAGSLKSSVIVRVADFQKKQHCSKGDQEVVCVEYWQSDYTVGATETTALTAQAGADACKMGLRARALIGTASSNKEMYNDTMSQTTSLGSGVTTANTAAAVYCETAMEAAPTQDTGEQSVSYQTAAATPTQIVFHQDVTGWDQFSLKPAIPPVIIASVQYRMLELYPVP